MKIFTLLHGVQIGRGAQTYSHFMGVRDTSSGKEAKA
jgi:hypothetical protein